MPIASQRTGGGMMMSRILIESDHELNVLRGIFIGSLLSLPLWLIIAALWIICGKMFVSQ